MAKDSSKTDAIREQREKNEAARRSGVRLRASAEATKPEPPPEPDDCDEPEDSIVMKREAAEAKSPKVHKPRASLVETVKSLKRGGARKGAGRPAAAGAPRSRQLSTYVTDAEFAGFVEASGDATLSDWARDVLLAAAANSHAVRLLARKA